MARKKIALIGSGMGFFAKAACLALKDVPSVNAYIEGDEIVYHDYVDISVAVSAPNGLVVPVVRDCDKKGFAQIEKDIADYGKRAKEGTLTMADMDLRTREDTSHPILIIFAALSLIGAIMGCTLMFRRRKARRRSAVTNDG